MRELGFDLVYQIWGGIFAPAATPAEVIDRIDLACRKSLASAATEETLRRMHVNIRYMGNKEFGPFVRAEFERYGKLFRSLELKQME
ncbi:MAG: hypothetical protein EXR27_10490 [Betaproteobacteria bacterium]|nr:hypothetical protein [Betaproteobacteria bacterium]